MKTYRKFKKNAKALSPVIASIILIAVTVAVSVVVAAWMGAISIGFMGNAEQVTITNVQIDSVNDIATLTVLNSGTGSVEFSPSATVDGTAAPLVFVAPETDLVLAKGATGTYTISGAFDSGLQYTFKITTTKGNGLVYTATAL
jgi:flagellin-like protein